MSTLTCFLFLNCIRYLRHVLDTLLLQQLLVEPLGLLRRHVGLVFGEETHFVCVRPMPMWQRTGDRRMRQSCFTSEKPNEAVTVLRPDPHVNGLFSFGDLPKREQEADRFRLVQEQRVSHRLALDKSLQRLNCLFHLRETLTSDLKTQQQTRLYSETHAAGTL